MNRLALLTALWITPALAGPYDLPTEGETRTALTCLSRMTGLHWDGTLPRIVIAPGIADQAVNEDDRSASGFYGTTVAGNYTPSTRTVKLIETWQWSMLAHEMTHFLQDENGLFPHHLTKADRIRLNVLAYDVQAKWGQTCQSFWGQLLENPQ